MAAAAHPTPFVAAVGVQGSRQLHHDAQPVLRPGVHHLDLWVVEGVARIRDRKAGLPHADADEGVPPCTPIPQSAPITWQASGSGQYDHGLSWTPIQWQAGRLRSGHDQRTAQPFCCAVKELLR